LRRRPPIMLGLLAAVALAACSSGVVPASDAAPAAPHAQRRSGDCLTSMVAPVAGGHHLVTVDTDVTGAQLTWVPGLNSTACQVRATAVDGPAGTDLAADIDAAPAPPEGRTGSMLCGKDDVSGVLVALHTADDRWQSVYLTLSGCHAILAAGKKWRLVSDAVRADLAPLAPADWRRYFG
jgi:hypothetical protein